MSTRANIIITGQFGDRLYLYRHSDGYPERALPLLEKFCKHVNEGTIRRDASQASGWLIAFGMQEHNTLSPWENKGKAGVKWRTVSDIAPHKSLFSGWKVGSIEPTTDIHGDVEWVYHIDLRNLEGVKVETFNLAEEKDAQAVDKLRSLATRDINVLVTIEGGILYSVYASSDRVNVELIDNDELKENGNGGDDRYAVWKQTQEELGAIYAVY